MRTLLSEQKAGTESREPESPAVSGTGEIEPHLVPKPRRMFVNRNLRMDTIRAVGFDMDYTLARYVRRRIEALAHSLTIEKLIGRGYPEEIRKLQYDPTFVVRGLTVDKELGNILKLDRHSHTCRVFHGRRPLTKQQRRELYRRERLSFTPPRFAMVDTLFALPETCLYADLVDYFEARQGPRSLDTWQLFDDVRESIDEAHRDNSLKAMVKGNLDYYVEKDVDLARTLHKLRSSGKKLFLLTNSHFSYTCAVMTYLLDDQLSEYPSWQHYFDVVIVGAQKPSFFVHEEPFALLDEAGAVAEKPIKHSKLRRGGIYMGGNRLALEEGLGCGGDQILYVGDHIYGDILRSKKATLWRTALVLEELEDEIRHTEAHKEDYAVLFELEQRRRRLDSLINIQRQQLSELEKNLGAEASRQDEHFLRLKSERDQSKQALKEVLKRIGELEQRLDDAFNPDWGLTFKEEQENSRFGAQVEDYACLYTSRVSNFANYSAHQYFRSPGDLLPHEREP